MNEQNCFGQFRILNSITGIKFALMETKRKKQKFENYLLKILSGKKDVSY